MDIEKVLSTIPDELWILESDSLGSDSGLSLTGCSWISYYFPVSIFLFANKDECYPHRIIRTKVTILVNCLIQYWDMVNIQLTLVAIHFKKRCIFVSYVPTWEFDISCISPKCPNVPWNLYFCVHDWLWITASVVIWDHFCFTSYGVFLFSVLTQIWNAAPISGFPSKILISHKAIRNSRYNYWDRKMKSIYLLAPKSLEMAQTTWN